MLGLGISKSAQGVKSGIVKLLNSLKRRAEYFENKNDSKSTIKEINSYELLDKATILLTPTATSDARVHSVKTYTGELVTNGTFDTDSDWTKGTGITIGGGVATFTSTPSGQSVGQNAVASSLPNGAYAKVTFEVLSRTEGSFGIYFSGTLVGSRSSVGVFTAYFTKGTETSFYIRALGTTSGTISNVSVIDVSSDFDFDRASSATRINSDGLVQDMQSITDPELVLNGDFEELGDETTPASDFSTSAFEANPTSGSVSESNGTLTFNNSTSSGTQVQLKNRDISDNNTYKITFTLSNFTSGTFRMSVGNQLTDTINYNDSGAEGTHTFYVTKTGGSARNYFYTGGTSVVVSNISVKQVDPNSNWTVVDSDTNNYVELTEGFARLKFLNTSPITHFETSTQILQANQTYKLVVDVYDVTSGEIKIDGAGIQEFFTTEGVTTRYITPTGNTPLRFYRNSANVDITLASVSVKDVTFSTDVDLARINYDSNGENGHILLEPTSTNLVTYSEDFEDSSWNLDFAASFITRTPNAATSPSGKNNATKLIGNDTSRDPSNSYIGASTSASAPYSASIFAKKGEYDYLVLGIGGYNEGFYAIFNLSNGTVSTSPTASGTTASIEDYDNGWFRCIITTTSTLGTEILFTTPSVDGTLTTDYTSTTNGVYVWGAQLEELSYATSYIPNHGTALGVTRATETLTGSGNSTLINSTEGVLYAEIAKVQDDNDNYILISLNNAVSNSDENSVAVGFDDSNDFYVRLKAGNSDILKSDGQDATANNFHKIAIRYKNGDSAIYINGSEATYSVGDRTATFSFAVTLDNLSFDYDGNNGLPFYGKCKALAVFNEALEDDELELLTGVTNYGSFSELASANGYTII